MLASRTTETRQHMFTGVMAFWLNVKAIKINFIRQKSGIILIGHIFLRFSQKKLQIEFFFFNDLSFKSST